MSETYVTGATDEEEEEEEENSKQIYGDCVGPNSMYVKLISSDGYQFIIKRSDALVSKTIRNMLSGPGQCSESGTNKIHLKEIPSHVLKMVCLYFMYRVRYAGAFEVPEFPIAPELAVEMLLAASFFDC